MALSLLFVIFSVIDIRLRYTDMWLDLFYAEIVVINIIYWLVLGALLICLCIILFRVFLLSSMNGNMLLKIDFLSKASSTAFDWAYKGLFSSMDTQMVDKIVPLAEM